LQILAAELAMGQKKILLINRLLLELLMRMMLLLECYY
jgi:hypothetical protein